MSPENTKLLFSAFPRLFRGRALPITQNLMPFGFECGDGWFKLVYELAGEITAHAANNKLDPIATQVKEKYGRLCFYLHGEDRHILDLCDDAEEKSARICEECGAPGVLLEDRGWLMTRCPAHAPR